MQATHEYHKLLTTILKEGRRKGDRTGTGTISIFDYKIKFDMDQGFPLITTKRMYTRGIISELLWFLQGSKDIRDLWKNNVHIWDGNWYAMYSKSCSSPYSLEEMQNKIEDTSIDPSVWSLGPIYGKQWINWPTGINQIQEAVDKLHNNPDDRRIMVSAWNPSEINQMALPPCHWAFELYSDILTYDEREIYCKNKKIKLYTDEIADTNPLESLEDRIIRRMDRMTAKGVPTRRLSLKWHQRSVDTFLGLPFNIASYAFLLHMFAQQVNMVPGTLVGDLTNVHIYDNHIEYVKKQLERDPFTHEACTISLNGYTIDEKEKPFLKGIFNYELDDFCIKNYKAFNNFKNVPMAV